MNATPPTLIERWYKASAGRWLHHCRYCGLGQVDNGFVPADEPIQHRPGCPAQKGATKMTTNRTFLSDLEDEDTDRYLPATELVRAHADGLLDLKRKAQALRRDAERYSQVLAPAHTDAIIGSIDSTIAWLRAHWPEAFS